MCPEAAKNPTAAPAIAAPRKTSASGERLPARAEGEQEQDAVRDDAVAVVRAGDADLGREDSRHEDRDRRACAPEVAAAAQPGGDAGTAGEPQRDSRSGGEPVALDRLRRADMASA